MEISLDDINYDDMACAFSKHETETKIFNGRNVMTKSANPQTDEKVVWVSRKAYMGRTSNGTWEGEINFECEFGGKDSGKMNVRGKGEYKDNKGNGVGVTGSVNRDGNGPTKVGISVHPPGKGNKGNEK